VRTRLLLAAVCIFALQLWFTASGRNKQVNSASFATVAYAGHTTGGNWCQCATPGCICDPGELGRSNRPGSDQNEKASGPGASPIREHSRSGFDFGTGALVLALALFVWTRLRT
jgi:hypothetical protein